MDQALKIVMSYFYWSLYNYQYATFFSKHVLYNENWKIRNHKHSFLHKGTCLSLEQKLLDICIREIIEVTRLVRFQKKRERKQREQD